MTTTTRTNIHDYLTTRRAINALRDEQFAIMFSRHRDMDRYKAIQAEIDALRQKIGWTG